MRRERSWISEVPRLSVKTKSTLDQARPRLTTTTTTTNAHVSTLGVDEPQLRQLLSPRNDEPSVKRHRFSSSVAKSPNVVPEECPAFFVAPPGTTKPNVGRALLDAEAFLRCAPPLRSEASVMWRYVLRFVPPAQLLSKGRQRRTGGAPRVPRRTARDRRAVSMNEASLKVASTIGALRPCAHTTINRKGERKLQ
jgi:hypothetical protein